MEQAIGCDHALIGPEQATDAEIERGAAQISYSSASFLDNQGARRLIPDFVAKRLRSRHADEKGLRDCPDFLECPSRTVRCR